MREIGTCVSDSLLQRPSGTRGRWACSESWVGWVELAKQSMPTLAQFTAKQIVKGLFRFTTTKHFVKISICFQTRNLFDPLDSSANLSVHNVY